MSQTTNLPTEGESDVNGDRMQCEVMVKNWFDKEPYRCTRHAKREVDGEHVCGFHIWTRARALAKTKAALEHDPPLLEALRRWLQELDEMIARTRLRLATLENAKCGIAAAIDAEARLQSAPTPHGQGSGSAIATVPIPESLLRFLSGAPPVRLAVLAVLAALGDTSLDRVCEILDAHGLRRTDLRKQIRTAMLPERRNGIVRVSEDGQMYALVGEARLKYLPQTRRGYAALASKKSAQTEQEPMKGIAVEANEDSKAKGEA